MIVRDKVGSYQSAKDCEVELQSWLQQYSSERSDLKPEMAARYPVRRAIVKITEMQGKPGHYQGVIHMKTHYTVDQLVSDLKLTTELGGAAGQLV